MGRRAVGLLSEQISSLAHAPGPAELGSSKLRCIDIACGRLGARSLADLGAVWAVDAGYGLYAHDRYRLDRLVVVDEKFTPSVERRASTAPSIELVRGNFGSSDVRDRVGEVGAVVLFDVLLHQVSPDWDQILEMYAPLTQRFVIAGPWYASDGTIRLTDLERDEYRALVPELPIHDYAYDHLDEINAERGRNWRDVHDIWQWGITESDLRHRLRNLGFELAYYEKLGRWRGLASFEDCSFVFARRGLLGL